MFGKNDNTPEPPVPTVPWADAWEFGISDEERPVTPHRKQAVMGPRAFRVAQGRGAQRVLAPCAFFPPSSRPKAAEKGLYMDPEGHQLLCSVGEPEHVNGMRHYRVHDAHGEPIGTIRRISPLKHALKPTWRIDQPGRPEITSSAEWAEGGRKEVVQRGAGKLLLGVVQAVADMGAEGGDQPSKSRVLEWRSGKELVMTSDHDARYLIRADWLDRRLVFAYGLLRNG
ncbi:hypothetical protein ACIF9R_29410 [Streptomyces sp. NPDC086080]|uniref:hypothetical protein n=1 Tax=Streptomyces sp. NPDC086080 TaxID=3365748 RepID=UPI0037D3149D